MVISCSQAFAQKQVYIPAYLRNINDVNGKQFSMTKTAQSPNFILIWGNTVGTDPASYPDRGLAFNPKTVLDTLEAVYIMFKKSGLIYDEPGTQMAKYKSVVIMYNTWGPNGSEGFANGGTADGVIGAFWCHPDAMRDGGVMAHEFTHSLQFMITVDKQNKFLTKEAFENGLFYESHANFMRNRYVPKAVTTDIDYWHTLSPEPDWKVAYECYQWLMHIEIEQGINMTNRLWRECFDDEFPLATYRRINKYDQNTFNDVMYRYARRMACYDYPLYNWGTHFRESRENSLKYDLPRAQRVYDILEPINVSKGKYIIPDELAPQDYGYNIIPLYPQSDNPVFVQFKGHTEVNSHAGWRYGFVTEKADKTVSRYGTFYGEATKTIGIELQPGESKLYLVVMGAPSDNLTIKPNTNSTWQGFPKHFRYPYEITLTNAVPEGYQGASAFRSQLKNTNGKIHPNGGGYIENSTVSSSVYVGPYAIVKNSNLSGNVRVEGTAMVYNAILKDTVVVKDNALIDKGTYSGRALILDNCKVVNATMYGRARVGGLACVNNYKLHGTVKVGGDAVVYNDKGECDRGTHNVLTNFYENKMLECDGKDSTAPRNLDINNKIKVDTTTCNAIITNSGKATICMGESTTLNANSGTVYSWFIGPNPALFVTKSVKIASAGKYTVQVSNGTCQAVSSAYAITVNPVPSISIISPVNNATLTTDIFPIKTTVTGTNISNVSLYNGISLLRTKMIIPYNFNTPSMVNGTYTFSAITKNTFNCTDTAKVTVNVNKVVNDLEASYDLSSSIYTYPNPFQESMKIMASGSFSYILYNTVGLEVEKGAGNGNIVVGESLPEGLYILKVKSDNIEKTMKVNKSK